MFLHESGEMYLETIYVLSKSNGFVRSIDISAHMGFSKPSVSRAVGLLRKSGYINVDKDGGITLTDSGREIAEKIFERHTVITNMLIQFGVEPEVAAADACKMEHAISDTSLEAIKNFMNKQKKPH